MELFLTMKIIKITNDSNMLNLIEEKNAKTKERFAITSILGMISAGKTIRLDNIYINLL